jgi:hypothetical protein
LFPDHHKKEWHFAASFVQQLQLFRTALPHVRPTAGAVKLTQHSDMEPLQAASTKMADFDIVLVFGLSGLLTWISTIFPEGIRKLGGFMGRGAYGSPALFNSLLHCSDGSHNPL